MRVSIARSNPRAVVGNTTTASHPSRRIATRCSSGSGGSAQCGRRDGDGAQWHVELFAGTLSVVDANRFRHPAQFSGCTLEANRLSPLATTRPRRSDQRVDQGLFALRRGPEKAGHAGKDTTACIAVGDASIAFTGVHKRSRLIDQARRAAARHTADVIPHHLLTTGRRS